VKAANVHFYIYIYIYIYIYVEDAILYQLMNVLVKYHEISI
jgi:hypothetical protein